MIKNYYRVTNINGIVLAEKATAFEASDITGVSPCSVRASARNSGLIQKKYYVEEVEEDVIKHSIPCSLWIEFDEICAILRNFDLSNVKLTTIEK